MNFTESEIKAIDFRIVSHCKLSKINLPDEKKTKFLIERLGQAMEAQGISLQSALDKYFPVVEPTDSDNKQGSASGNKFLVTQIKYRG